MLHAHSFKHLAVKIQTMVEAFIQVRAGKKPSGDHGDKKNFFFFGGGGQMPHSMQLQTSFLFRSHQVKASSAMSCVLLQFEAIQN